MKNILFLNNKFEEIKEIFKKEGLAKIHILADFDKTLTKAFVNRKEVPSIISILRDGNYLTSDYASKAHDLYNKYHPFENDISISKEEKKRLMEEWWTMHFELLIKSGLNKKDIERVVQSKTIQFRDGFSELADFLNKNNIPLVIMSSAGLGEESISLKLRNEGKLYNNIYIISNSFDWDNNGNAVRVKKPIVHMANKDETLIENFPVIFDAVKDRKNVLLIGDGLNDVEMIEGFNYDNLIKIGFLNNNEKIEDYKKVYDVLILNDSSLDFINSFLQGIKSF